METFETSRLLLRKISPMHASFYLELLNSKGWLKYIGDRNVGTEEEAATYIIEKYLPSFEKNGFGSYTVFLKETDQPIGSCGLYKREELDNPDIGFAFLTEYLSLIHI